MAKKVKRVVEYKEKDLSWQFHGGAAPRVRVGGQVKGGYRSSEEVDPTPAYPHVKSDVEKHLIELESKMEQKGYALKFKPNFYILPREGTSRTQGWADRDMIYYDENGDSIPDDKPQWEGNIVLSAKRTPVHPAVTKYLVAHEYGHHASWQRLLFTPYREDASMPYQMYQDYAKFRGLPKSWDDNKYGPGSWHTAPGEVLANDFRILIAETDVDWWPHPCEHPSEKEKQLRDWWDEVLTLGQ